jgi:hypothetical protein
MRDMRQKCVHGVPGGCPTCNKPSGGSTKPTVTGILVFLKEVQIRATYGAVADAVGMRPDHLSTKLGGRRPLASWVVSSEDGRPTGYSADEIDPALFTNKEVIRSSSELVRRMKEWRASKVTQ